MTMLAIVDDDASARARLAGFARCYMQENAEPLEIREYSSAVDLLHHYKPQYDIIFLDIEMSEVDGIRAAHIIRETDPTTILIFVTNMAQLAIKGYEVEALDFIVKPIDYGSFAMVMHRASQRVERRRGQTLSLTARGTTQIVAFDRIGYVEVRNHYITYHTTEGDITVKGTLAQAEEALRQGNFMRCNRWYLINIDNVTGIDGNRVTVGDWTVEVSRSKKQEIMRAVTLSMGAVR
ncbi:LytR/AlgR family response regulator transcription factor [Bifidobacterium moukalabense]|uniref:LytR/AlgR family response regulator transcription factor n=1 Tax=Bifidobacterium moukalabense TaxID=1333651 RepID=UPI0010F7D3D8|nr:LytTR family DNA-binding domain-containing protein [Bifidobacterium moukalabense]